mgnify:CR=1 FL=1
MVNKDKKRGLSSKDKQILYTNAEGKCEACDREIEFSDMLAGHKDVAWSKGGQTILENSACLCFRCNKFQGTDPWDVFMKKIKTKDKKIEVKADEIILKNLSLKQLRYIVNRYKLAEFVFSDNSLTKPVCIQKINENKISNKKIKTALTEI